MGYWNKQSIKLTTPKTFKCVRCGVEEEALPTGITDVLGGTHFVYTTPLGWWNMTTEVGMVLFCPDEDVGRVTDEIIDATDNMEVQPCRKLREGRTTRKTLNGMLPAGSASSRPAGRVRP